MAQSFDGWLQPVNRFGDVGPEAEFEDDEIIALDHLDNEAGAVVLHHQPNTLAHQGARRKRAAVLQHDGNVSAAQTQALGLALVRAVPLHRFAGRFEQDRAARAFDALHQLFKQLSKRHTHLLTGSISDKLRRDYNGRRGGLPELSGTPTPADAV